MLAMISADRAPGMVELPLSEGLTDATHFRRRLAQSRAEAFLNEELDALLPEDGFACITLHPRADIGVAREARVPVLLRLLDRARADSGCVLIASPPRSCLPRVPVLPYRRRSGERTLPG